MARITLFTLLFLSVLGRTTAQDFVVQVGAFNQKVPLSYFTGLTGVYEHVDQNQIYHYYIGGFAKQNEAQTAADAAKKAGFHAYVINMEEVRQQCNGSCRLPTLRWIFFDFDKADLRADSKNQLNRLANILKEHKDWKATLSAHTDAKGSDEYNVGLSQRRAEAAKSYLVAAGIAIARLNAATHGETQPIAKNEVGSADSPEGRQFNRRVELIILDEKGREMNEVVDEPTIPTRLKN